MVQTFQHLWQGKKLQRKAKNFDIWQRMTQEMSRLKASQEPITVHWIKAHTADNIHEDEWHQLDTHVLGNLQADKLAKHFAKKSEEETIVRDSRILCRETVTSTAQMMVSIQKEVLKHIKITGLPGPDGPRPGWAGKRRKIDKPRRKRNRDQPNEEEEQENQGPVQRRRADNSYPQGPEPQAQADLISHHEVPQEEPQHDHGPAPRRGRRPADPIRIPWRHRVEHPHDLLQKHNKVVCTKCGRLATIKGRARLFDNCAGAPQTTKQRRALAMLTEENIGQGQQHTPRKLGETIVCSTCGKTARTPGNIRRTPCAGRPFTNAARERLQALSEEENAEDLREVVYGLRQLHRH